MMNAGPGHTDASNIYSGNHSTIASNASALESNPGRVHAITSPIDWDKQKQSFYAQMASIIQQMQRSIGLDARGEYVNMINPAVIAEFINKKGGQTTITINTTNTDEEDSVTIDNVNVNAVALLDPDTFSDYEYNQCLVPIEIEDGNPCIDGYPIWERLEGEPNNYYKLFKEYREMKYGFIRRNAEPARDIRVSVSTPRAVDVEEQTTTGTNGTNGVNKPGAAIEYIRNNNPSMATRSLAALSDLTAINGRQLKLLSTIYNWIQRCNAYDRYKASLCLMEKQRQIEMLESKHGRVSNKLLEQAMNYFEENPNELNPKTALEMVELGMKYGRISAGLFGDKPGSSDLKVANQTNIAITNSTNSTEQNLSLGNTSNVGVMQNAGNGVQDGVSLVAKQLKQKMQDPNQMMSVLSILQSSGAVAASFRAPAKSDENAMDEENNTADIYEADGLHITQDGSVITKEDEVLRRKVAALNKPLYGNVIELSVGSTPNTIEAFVDSNGGNADG